MEDFPPIPRLIKDERKRFCNLSSIDRMKGLMKGLERETKYLMINGPEYTAGYNEHKQYRDMLIKKIREVSDNGNSGKR